MPVTKKILARFPFIEPLTPSDLARVARAAARLVVPARTKLINQGDPGDQFYMIVSGQVQIYSDGAGAPEQLNLLGAGAWFGELALIDNHPRSASVRTLRKSVLITLPKNEFLWLVTAYPLALFRIVSGIQETLRARDLAFRAEVELRASQLGKLYMTALDITRHRERNEALRDLRARAVELLTSAGGELYLYDAQGQMLVPQATEIPLPPCPVGKGCPGRAFASGHAQVRRTRHEERKHELAAPIKITDANSVERSLGVLSVYRSARDAPYQKTDQTLLELFASQAAIVIENAELMQVQLDKARLDGELNAARAVQRSLIPERAPHIRGYELAAAWEPARQVSGDLYDFIPLPDQRWAILIADVSDKGTPAALFMASARSILRASANLGGTAVELIERANRAIAMDSSGGMFVTVFLCILDPRAHTCSYVNAGHNNPLHIQSRDKFVPLRGDNLALGVLEDFAFEGTVIELAPGDLLLLYTDGVTEATNSQNELFGEARLHALVARSGQKSARELLRELQRQVRAFTGEIPQSDDITAVVLRRI